MNNLLNSNFLEVLNHVNPDWLVYSTGKTNFYDGRTHKKVKAGKAVGISFPTEGSTKEGEVLFKHIKIFPAYPRALRRAQAACTRWNKREAQLPVDDLEYFLAPPSSIESASRAVSEPPNLDPLQQNE